MPKLEVPEDLKYVCPLCAGTGRKIVTDFDSPGIPGEDRSSHEISCHFCHGLGSVIKGADELVAEIVRLRAVNAELGQRQRDLHAVIVGLKDVMAGKVRQLSEIEADLGIKNELPHQCDHCGATNGSLTLSGTCHPGAPSYPVVTGQILTMECSECGLIIGRFLVASYIDEPVNPNEPVTT